MKRALKRMVPLLLAIFILASVAWYLLVYDREFTRDMLISNARFYDSNGNTKFAAMLYDWAYHYTGQDEDVAIELANQYKSDGNFTKAEYTLTNAIADGGTTDLYIALCKTFVEQDKLLDAATMLDNIANPAIKAELDALRPAAPQPDVAPGYYTDYFSVNITSESGTLYCTLDGTFPSAKSEPLTEAIALYGGETVIYSISVGDNGLVSPLTILGYTIGGVIEEAVFTDPAMENAVRMALGVDEEHVLMTDELWEITQLTVPEDATTLADLALLPYLEVLQISNFRFDNLSNLASLNSLVRLDMTGCRFPATELQVIAKLPMLEHLTLADCGLSTIADLIDAQNLRYLDLSGNTLRNLDPIANMSGICELYLQHNAVTSLNTIGTLKSLDKLDISYNSVSDLTPLSNCPKLKWLNAGNNIISNLQGVDLLTSLTHLDLDQNQLTDISLLSQCGNLEELNVSNNALTDLSALAGMVNLVNLNFSFNAVTELPSWPEEALLSVIDGSYNQLKSIQNLGKLKELTYVYMDYNQLTTLDPIANCYRLVMVNAYGNEIEDITKLTDHNIIVNYDPT